MKMAVHPANLDPLVVDLMRNCLSLEIQAPLTIRR